MVELGLAFTAWGIALAVGILVIGHRLAHRIGYVQTVGVALVGLLGCTLLFATSHSLGTSLVALTASGLFMGLANANLTDLALGLGSPDRRTTTGAFNVVRWGAAAPAPVVAGLLAEHVSLAAPFWAAAIALGVGLLVFLATAHTMAAGMGERSMWALWNRRAQVVEGAPEEALVEAY